MARALVVALVLVPGFLLGHGDLHLQIEQITVKIKQSPKDPGLYMQRGELHRLHQELDEALADFEMARTLDPGLPMLDLAVGRVLLDASLALSAKTVLDRHLQTYTNHTEGYVLRARAWMRLRTPLKAADDYERAIAVSPMPGPELFVDRARAFTNAGPDHFEKALQCLDDGILRLGPLVTLQLPAIELEVHNKFYDQALARIDKLATQTPRKETWLKRRGDILALSGKSEAARQSYQQALAAMESLPAARRYVPAMAELEKGIRTALNALPADSAQTTP